MKLTSRNVTIDLNTEVKHAFDITMELDWKDLGLKRVCSCCGPTAEELKEYVDRSTIELTILETAHYCTHNHKALRKVISRLNKLKLSNYKAWSTRRQMAYRS